MTIARIEAMTDLTITAAVVAALLGQDPQNIRDQAQRDPKKLGYPVIVTGRRVKIPRVPFLQFIRGYEVPHDC